MTNSLKTGDNRQPPAKASSYEVGYGKPPLHTRVKPGQVLNPRGRPKCQRNIATVLRKALNERTKIREGDQTRTVTKQEALILKMINDSHTKEKVQANLIGLMRSAGLIDVAEEAPQQAPLTGNDAAVIAEYYERHRGQLGLSPTPEVTAPKDNKTS